MPQWSASARTNTPANAFRRLPFVVLLGIYFVLAGIYSIVTPSFEASDELWHYPFIKRLADGEGLPVQRPDQVGPWRQEGSQPPLYYALGALLTFPVDTSDMDAVRWLNPHADIGVPKADRNVNMVIHPPAVSSYTGTLLALHIVRWFSVLLGGVTVLATYLMARQLFADELLALTTTGIVAFNAMFLFITSSVNNDALVISLCSLALWLMVHFITSRPSVMQWFGLGCIIGLAVLTKTSALALAPVAALTALVVACHHHSWDDFLYAGIALLVPVLAIDGWWFLRNWRLYGDPLGLNAFVAIVGPRYPVPSLRQLAGEWQGFVMSYWGFFGGVNVPAPEWYYQVMNVLALLGFIGSPVYLWQQHKQGRLKGRHWWQLAITVIFPVIVFIALIRWTLMTIASQGRLMFPAISAISLWMAMGWGGILRGKLRYILPALGGGFMLVTALWMPFFIIAPAYALPKTTHVSELAPQNPVNVVYDNKIRLVGFDLAQSKLAPGEPVTITLYWEALAPLDKDYTAFVHLLSADNLIVGQRDRYPGQGNYPTSLWQPGEAFSDTFVIPTDSTILTPNSVTIETGFYTSSDGIRLPIVESSLKTQADAAVLSQLEVPLREVGGIPNPTFIDFGGQIALVGYALDRTSVKPGETVHLSLYWQAQTDIKVNYTVFTHIIGKDQRMLAQKDSWPQGGQAPTSSWHKGQLIKDDYELVIADSAEPEIAELEIGLYDSNLQRLPVLGKGGFVQDTRLVLGKFRVLSK